MEAVTQRSNACGKCVLFGEHSILYGSSAIALPLKKLQLNITFKAGPKNQLILEGNESFPNSQEIFWKLIEKDFSDVSAKGEYHICSQIPLGAGLGSSAALSIALHRLHRPQLNSHELIEHAWKSENFFHGKSSGMDPCTIATEKALCFRGINDFDILDDSFLKDDRYVFALADSHIRRSAQSGISLGQKLKEDNPSLWQNILKGLQDLALEGRDYFEKCQALQLGQAMNEAHKLLKEWGLSHPELEKLRDVLLENKALGAKLTGAGRGGFLISIFERSAWLSLKARQNSSALRFFELGV